MLSLLQFRETGVDAPRTIVRAQTTIRCHELELSKYRDIKIKNPSGVNSLSLDPVEYRYLLSGTANGSICIHDMEHCSSTPLYTHPTVCEVDSDSRLAHKNSISTVQWYPIDTGLFVSSGMDKRLVIWDTNKMAPADIYNFEEIILSHHMSPIATRHSYIAVANGAKITLVDMRTGSNTHSLKGTKKQVISVQWSPNDPNILASGGVDNCIRLWDIRSAKSNFMLLDQHNGDTTASPEAENTAHNGHVNGLCFSPNGLYLLSFGTDSRVRLWDTLSGKNKLLNFGRIHNNSRTNIQLAISDFSQPDVAYIPHGANVEVFDISSGKNVKTLRGHFNGVRCVVFNPSTQELYSGAQDRNILIFSGNTETETTFGEHLDSQTTKKDGAKKNSFLRRIGANDDWSSDSD